MGPRLGSIDYYEHEPSLSSLYIPRLLLKLPYLDVAVNLPIRKWDDRSIAHLSIRQRARID